MRRPYLWIAGAIVLSVVAGSAGYCALTQETGADTSYDTRVADPALKARHPRVLYDQGHRNLHSARGRYGPFVSLIESDGCQVTPHEGVLTAEALAKADLLVIVNARGPDENRAGSAFTPAECDAVHAWVSGGGALLLAADHYPFGEAAAALGARFGVNMSGGWTEDPPHARAGVGDTGQVVYRKAEGGLADHPIMRGRGGADIVSTVEAFTGQSLSGPADATALLKLGEAAMDHVPTSQTSKKEGDKVTTTFETRDTSAKGRCQGLAMRVGRGRVVMLGEAAMLTAQIGKDGAAFGMNAPDNDNRAFALNVVRWLTGALPD